MYSVTVVGGACGVVKCVQKIVNSSRWYMCTHGIHTVSFVQ